MADRKGRILIVDDEEEGRRLFAAAAEKSGHEVVLAHTGLSAKKEMEQDKFDVMILDLGLPDIDGIELLKQAKNLKRDIAVIVVTARESKSAPIEALNAGAFGYIQKPCKMEELASSIDRAVERQRLVEENKAMAKSLKEANVDLIQVNASLKQMVEARDEFVSMVSHELRNPLAVIYGFSETILKYFDRLEPKVMRNYLEIIRKDTHRLNRLIEELLNLSRLRAGKFQIYAETVRMENVVREIFEKLRPDFPEIELSVAFDDRISEIRTDKAKFGMVMENLLANAMKYSPSKGKIRVTGSLQPEGDFFDLHVIDEGPGVPPGDREKIFEAFYRTADPINRKFPGTGLGLTISRGLVKLLGGGISVVDAPGNGCDFVLTLPKEYKDHEEK